MLICKVVSEAWGPQCQDNVKKSAHELNGFPTPQDIGSQGQIWSYLRVPNGWSTGSGSARQPGAEQRVMGREKRAYLRAIKRIVSLSRCPSERDQDDRPRLYTSA